MSCALRPLFVTVTWGAGGSTASKSLELAEVCQRQLGLTTCLHLTCTNMNRALVDQAMSEAKLLGVRNILALRGDPPRSAEYGTENEADSNKDFAWAVDLVRYIRRSYGDYFCIGVAGYPEGHADDSHPTRQSIEQDLPYLIDKILAGADFIMTQIVYDIHAFADYESTLRAHPSGLFASLPIIPGLMPIQSHQVLKRLTYLSHVRLPRHISSQLDQVRSDDAAVKSAGIEILTNLVNEIKSLPKPSHLPRGFHFYTLNLEKSVSAILERCNLIGDSNGTEKAQQRGSTPSLTALDDSSGAAGIIERQNGPLLQANALLPAISSPSKLKSASDSSTNVASIEKESSTNFLSQSFIDRAATWDDYPNGRWGPSNSPAFGEIDGYGPNLKVGPATARNLWNHPTSRGDITAIFKQHVQGSLVCVPWSDEADPSVDGPLQAETKKIQRYLLDLIEGREFWTLASQPAVDGVTSDDEVFGWGPPGEGRIFQKPFVEFFTSRKCWENELREQLKRHDSHEIVWLKTDDKGTFECSTLQNDDSNLTGSSPSTNTTDTNAVTWGIFRGGEIITPTIIEAQSFSAWSEEAYGIWEEWRRVFPRGSKEEKFLESCRQDTVLVNVVGQHYAGNDGERIWKILTSC